MRDRAREREEEQARKAREREQRKRDSGLPVRSSLPLPCSRMAACVHDKGFTRSCGCTSCTAQPPLGLLNQVQDSVSPSLHIERVRPWSACLHAR